MAYLPVIAPGEIDYFSSVFQTPVVFHFAPKPAASPLNLKRPRSDDLLSPVRLKKRKTRHLVRSAHVLHPRQCNLRQVAAPAWLAHSTSCTGRPSKMAPQEGVWITVNLDVWVNQNCQQRMQEWRAKAERPGMVKRRSLPASLYPREVLPRPQLRHRSHSDPPEATALAISRAEPVESPDELRAQLLQTLKSRPSDPLAAKPSEASLRMRKWVIWNAWSRRPVFEMIASAPCPGPSPGTLQITQNSPANAQQRSLLSLSQHLLGDVTLYQPTDAARLALRCSLSSTSPAPLALREQNVSPRKTRRPRSSALRRPTLAGSKPKAKTQPPAQVTPRPRPYALRSVACAA